MLRMKNFQFVISLLLIFMFVPGLHAQSNITPIVDVLESSLDEQIVTVQGRIVQFRKDDEIFIQDPTGKILVELEDHHKMLSLKVGNEIEVKGEVDINFFFKTKKLEAFEINRLQ